MKLVTKEILARLPKLYATDGQPVPMKVAQVKFFTGSRGTWYGVEFDGSDVFYGYVVSLFGADMDEWGYFSLHELEEAGVERDLYFKPQAIGPLIEEAGRT